MNGVSLVTKSATGEVHSIVVKSGDRLRAVPVASDAEPWSSWIDDSCASFDDIKNCLDFDLQNELPEVLTTKVLCDIQDKAGLVAAYNTLILSDCDSFLRLKSKSNAMGNRFISKRVALKDDISHSLYNRPLNEFSDPVAAANFKASRFKTDTKYAAFRIQLKALRAFFDPDIGPGGGWRCPEGTLNGGQITDRFGRGCGGMTRRLGRLLDSLPFSSGRPGGRTRSASDLTESQIERARRTVQRAGSRDLRRSERFVRRGEGRTERQAGRVFDRQQRQNSELARSFRRSPEYQSRRTEAVAAQVARRRQQRGRQLRRRNIDRAESMIAEEVRRLEPAARRETVGRVLPPSGGATERIRRLDEEKLNLRRQRRDATTPGVLRPNRSLASLEDIENAQERRVQQLLANRPWLDNPNWIPEIIGFMSDEDLRRLIEETDVVSPERFQRLGFEPRAIEEGKLAFLEAASDELENRANGVSVRNTVSEFNELNDMTDSQLQSLIKLEQTSEEFYRRFGRWSAESQRNSWLRSVAARDLLDKRRRERVNSARELRRERLGNLEGEGSTPGRRRRAVDEPVFEVSQQMADRPTESETFAKEQRSLNDPVKTDIIEERSLSQLQEIMRQSEEQFSFGRDPSGDFESAQQFARAYNAIAGEMRQAVRQLEAFDNGLISLSDEQVNDLESFLLQASRVSNRVLPNFDLTVLADTKVQMPFGRTVNLGLAHPMFSDDDRLAFIEGKADLVADINAAASDTDVPFENRMLRVSERLDEVRSSPRNTIESGTNPDDMRQMLREAGAKTFSRSDGQSFFTDVFGFDKDSVETVRNDVSKLREAQNLRQRFDELVQEYEGFSDPQIRMRLFVQTERDRHFAFDSLINILKESSSNPFSGPIGDDLIEILQKSGMLGSNIEIDRRRLSSPNERQTVLSEIQKNQNELYYGLSGAFDAIEANYLQRNDQIDSPDRYKFMVNLLEGRYEEAAKTVISLIADRRSDEIKDGLTQMLAANLQRSFPRGVNNAGLVDKINEAASMGFVTEDLDSDSVLAQSRESLQRRQNIISNLGPQAKERLDDLVQKAWDRRRSAVGGWLRERFGSSDARPWEDYRNRQGEHPLDPFDFEDQLDAYTTDPAEKRRIDDWLKQIFEIEYTTPDGRTYVSNITYIGASTADNGITVEGVIEYRSENGDNVVGQFSRVIGSDSFGMTARDTIHNSYFEIFDSGKPGDPLHKNSGFGTIFNQNAWNWFKDAGFNKISIHAALDDGPYVWGRSGFHHIKVDDVKSLWSRVNQEILRYQNNESSIIKTSLQAAMLKRLSDLAKGFYFSPQSSPSLMHLIVALESDTDEPSARKAEVRNWIIDSGLGLSRAEFDLDVNDLSPIEPTGVKFMRHVSPAVKFAQKTPRHKRHGKQLNYMFCGQNFKKNGLIS